MYIHNIRQSYGNEGHMNVIITLNVSPMNSVHVNNITIASMSKRVNSTSQYAGKASCDCATVVHSEVQQTAVIN